MMMSEALCDCELARLEVGEFHSKLEAGEDLSEVGETPHHRCEVRNASGLRTRGQSKAAVLGVEGHLLPLLARQPGSNPNDDYLTWSRVHHSLLAVTQRSEEHTSELQS